MTNPTERKKQLIAQGALQRAHVVLDRHAVLSRLQPDVLVKSVVQRLAGKSAAAFIARGAASLPPHLVTLLPALLPILLRATVLLGRSRGIRRAVMPVAAATAATAVAAAVAIYIKRRSR